MPATAAITIARRMNRMGRRGKPCAWDNSVVRMMADPSGTQGTSFPFVRLGSLLEAAGTPLRGTSLDVTPVTDVAPRPGWLPGSRCGYAYPP
jgi:hypothetical protein